MVRELHLRATVLPGGKIEIESPELTAGEDVNVTIAPVQEPNQSGKRSILEILADAPGHRLFKTAEPSSFMSHNILQCSVTLSRSPDQSD